MENNKSSLFRIVASRQEIKITQFYRLMQRKWYLFLLFAMLGAFLGLLYYNWVEPVYKSTATILYKSNVNQASLTTVFKDLELQSKNANIQDQVELLTSYYIISKALQNLNWEVSYYKLSFFKQMDLYKREPFIVIATKGYAQTLDVPLRIKPVSNEFYTIEANEKLDSFGIMKQVKFKGKGEFGIPFKNDFFNFTINKINTIPLEIGETYKIIFNDIHEMAVVYQEKMNAKLAGEGANLIHLELESSPHIRGVDFLNAIAKEYIQFGLDDKDKVAKYTVAFIDQQILGITDPLKYTSDELTAFRSQNRTVDLERESSLVVQKAQEIDKNAALLRIRLDYYKNILNYVGNTAQIKNLAAPSIVGVTDPALNSLVAKLAELYSERETLSYTVQPKNPILLDLNKQISYTQQSLKENINNLVTNTEADSLDDFQEQVDAAWTRHEAMSDIIHSLSITGLVDMLTRCGFELIGTPKLAYVDSVVVIQASKVCDLPERTADGVGSLLVDALSGNASVVAPTVVSVVPSRRSGPEVFISYAHEDIGVANQVKAFLEDQAIACWVASRDVTNRDNYPAEIVEAIDGCRVMILILSKASNESDHTIREVGLAADRKIPIIPLRLAEVPPSKGLAYYLINVNWLDAFPVPISQHFPRLGEKVKALLSSRDVVAPPPAWAG